MINFFIYNDNNKLNKKKNKYNNVKNSQMNTPPELYTMTQWR